MNPEPTMPMQADVTEPRAGSSGVPLWLIILSFLLLFLGMVYFDRNGGWFKTEVYVPFRNETELANAQPPTTGFPRALAQKKFEATCGVCHQPTGMGVPGQFPPLVGSEWANGSPNRLIRIPLVGLVGPITIKGQPWNASMASLGGTLNDEDLALILTYVRSSWGNKASEVTPAQVKAVRAELGSRSQQITEPELLKVPEEKVAEVK
jgi:mono/diheme cytochrome c family protein